jgi:hypothetical protein
MGIGGFQITSDLIGLHFQQQQQQFNQQQLVIAQQQSQIQQLEGMYRLGIAGRSRDNEAEVKPAAPTVPVDRVHTINSKSEESYQTELEMLRAKIGSDEAAIDGLQHELRDLLVHNTQLLAEVEGLRRMPKSPQQEQWQVRLLRAG